MTASIQREEAARPIALPWARARARAVLLTALIAAGYSASLYANLPGHFEPDSLWQLGQGRSGVYNAWHPPVMAWLLGLADRLVAGAAPFIVFQGALFFGALGAFAALSTRISVVGLGALALLMLSPLVFLYQGVVWKDVLFADASVAGFALLCWAGRAWHRPLQRVCFLAPAFVLFTLAALVRQNGVLVSISGAGALGCMTYLALRADGRPRRPALNGAILYGATSIAFMAILGGTGAWMLDRHSDHRPETLNQLRSLQVYDLTGATRLEPTLRLPLLAREFPELARFIRTEAVPAYSPVRLDSLETLPGADTLLSPTNPVVGRQWRSVIATSPLLYLRARLNVFRWLFMTPDVSKCSPVFTGIDRDHPDLLSMAGLAPRYDARDDVLSRYGEAFLGTPVFSHLLYAIVGILLLIPLGRDVRRGGALDAIPVAAMLVAAYLFTASFFVIGIACDYRYLYFLDAAVMAALVHRACAWTAGTMRLPAFLLRQRATPSENDLNHPYPTSTVQENDHA